MTNKQKKIIFFFIFSFLNRVETNLPKNKRIQSAPIGKRSNNESFTGSDNSRTTFEASKSRSCARCPSCNGKLRKQITEKSTTEWK